MAYIFQKNIGEVNFAFRLGNDYDPPLDDRHKKHLDNLIEWFLKEMPFCYLDSTICEEVYIEKALSAAKLMLRWKEENRFPMAGEKREELS